MFKGPWLRAAKKLLGNGDRGVPNALVFLTKIESQFAASDEAKEAAQLLDGMSKDAKTKDAVETARAVEKARLAVLEGRTEFQLGHNAKSKEILDKAAADPHAQSFEGEIKETLAAMTPEK